jgi:PAS domain S-box-containing protein
VSVRPDDNPADHGSARKRVLLQFAAVLFIVLGSALVCGFIAQRAFRAHVRAYDRTSQLLTDIGAVRDERLDAGVAVSLYALTGSREQLLELQLQRRDLISSLDRLAELSNADELPTVQELRRANAEIAAYSNKEVIPRAGGTNVNGPLAEYHRRDGVLADLLDSFATIVARDAAHATKAAAHEQRKAYAAGLVGLLLGTAAISAFALRVRRLLLRLEERERLYRVVVEGARDAITVTDSNGEIRYRSPSSEAIVGDPQSRKGVDLVHPDDLPLALAARARAAADGFSGLFSLRVGNPEDGWTPVEGTTTTVRDKTTGTDLFVSIMRDVSERQRLQMQLMRAEKMEAVGTLAGGVSHDFNNVLAALMGYAELARDHAEADETLRSYLDEIVTATQRGRALTAQLLAFARQEQAAEATTLDVNETLSELVPMLRRLVSLAITFDVHLEPSLAPILINRTRLEQILLNLVANAADAIDGKAGTLRIATRMEAGEVVLEVSDTGSGMDEATQRQIFDPFFTTKPAGKGTGIGLSNVYGAVEEAAGHLTVSSEVGVGTTFRIAFTAVDAPTTRVEPARAPKRVSSAGGTILVVDDEETIGSLLGTYLEQHGYTTLVASNGPQAVELALAYEGDIDLLLTDFRMPGMNGGELATKLLELRPALKVIVMSGDRAKDDIPIDTMIVGKPFALDEMLQLIGATLAP